MGLEDYRIALRTAVSSESKAYGFTLVVWGTAALTTSEQGPPGRAGTVAYLGGLLGGMAVVVLLALGGPTATWSTSHLRRYAAGAIHVVSVAAATAAGWGCAVLVERKWLAYLVAGFFASLVYQLVLGMEVAGTMAGDGSSPSEPSRRRRSSGRSTC